MMSSAASLPSPALIMSYQLLAGRIGEDVRLSGEQVGEEAHVVGVVGDDEEIERPRELRLLPARRGQLLAAREAVRVFDARGGSRRRRRPSTSRCAGACRRSRRASDSLIWPLGRQPRLPAWRNRAAVAALFSSFLAQAVTAIANAKQHRVRRPLVNIVCLPPDWMRSHVGSMTLEPRPVIGRDSTVNWPIREWAASRTRVSKTPPSLSRGTA